MSEDGKPKENPADSQGQHKITDNMDGQPIQPTSSPPKPLDKNGQNRGMPAEFLNEVNKATRFNSAGGISAVEAGVRGRQSQAEKRARQQNLQEILKVFLTLPVKKKVTPLSEIEDLDGLEGADLTVMEKGLLEIIKNTQKDGGSIMAMDAIIKWAGMLPVTETKVTQEGINTIQFITKSPKDDIDKLYPEIERLGKKHNLSIPTKEELEGLREY